MLPRRDTVKPVRTRLTSTHSCFSYPSFAARAPRHERADADLPPPRASHTSLHTSEPLSQATDAAFYEHGGDDVLLEVARLGRASLDSPAVRLAWTTTTARVTPAKILRTKTRAPSPTIVLARAASPTFTDDSARKLSGSREESPEVDEDEFFCTPPTPSLDAADVLGNIAEQLKKIKHRRTRRFPTRIGSVSPPPAPPPSPSRQVRTRDLTRTPSAATPLARRRLSMVSEDSESDDTNGNSENISPFDTQEPSVGVSTPASTLALLQFGVRTSLRLARSHDIVQPAPAATKAKGGKVKQSKTKATPLKAPKKPITATPTPSKRKRASVGAASAKAVHFAHDVKCDDSDSEEGDTKSTKGIGKQSDKKSIVVSASKSPLKKLKMSPPKRVGGGYSDAELLLMETQDPTTWKRIVGNRRSAANSKARRDALLNQVREENEKLKAENALLKKRLTMEGKGKGKR